MMKSNKGFSLVELLIVAGLMGVMILGLGQLFKNQTSNQKTVAFNYEVANLKEEITQTLRNSNACQLSLAGTQLWPNGAQFPLQVTSLQNSLGVKKFEVGQTYNDHTVKLTNISVSAFSQDPTISATGEATLSLEFEKVGLSIGAKKVVKTIPLQIQLGTSMPNTNKVLGCSATSSLQGVAASSGGAASACIESTSACQGSYEKVGEITRYGCMIFILNSVTVPSAGTYIPDSSTPCPAVAYVMNYIKQSQTLFNICCPKP